LKKTVFVQLHVNFDAGFHLSGKNLALHLHCRKPTGVIAFGIINNQYKG
jgi:hypothetical protein